MDEVYLDYNASTPLDPRVAEAMLPELRGGVSASTGNASSAHRFGMRRKAAVDKAREHIAALVSGQPAGVIFSSGATEANNLALIGLAQNAPAERNRIVISATEHASVRQVAQWLHSQGQAKLDVVGVTSGGLVDLAELDVLLSPDVLAVSVMAANSETGVCNPIAAVAEKAHCVGALLHCDATQMVGRLSFDMSALGADLVSLSSHKIYGPGGVGALIGTHAALQQLKPLLHGGGHEQGLRSGSLNVAGIVGLGTAAAICTQERSTEAVAVAKLRDYLVCELQNVLAGTTQNGDSSCLLPNTASLRFAEADAEAVMHNMDPVAVSTGSACSSGSIEPSQVLLAMGLSHQAAFETVRFSLGRFTTKTEIDRAILQTVTAVRYVREMTKALN